MHSDIEPDFVEEDERPHRHAELDEQPVDAARARAGCEQSHGLVEIRTEHTIDEEARDVLNHDGRLAEP